MNSHQMGCSLILNSQNGSINGIKNLHLYIRFMDTTLKMLKLKTGHNKGGKRGKEGGGELSKSIYKKGNLSKSL